MDYKRIYDTIISYRKRNIPSGYKEKHHILPRSIGGNDEDENLVYLTAREHFLCHYLLTKMFDYETLEWYKMHHAFIIMKTNSDNQQRYFNSRLYESRKVHFSQVMKKEQIGEKNSQFGTKWIYNETQRQNKKIAKNEIIPDGWTKGRKINWDDSIKICKVCNEKFTPKTKELFCSSECKTRNNMPSFVGREQEFLELYRKTNSMNKSLKEMGYPGAVSYYYKWAKEIIKTLQ